MSAMLRRILVALFGILVGIDVEVGCPISKAATKSFAFSSIVGSPI